MLKKRSARIKMTTPMLSILLGAATLGAALFAADSSQATSRRVRPPATAAAIPFNARVTIGEGGSHILGNPSARVKLVEYASYTCSHCADFAEQATASLRSRYIASGAVSFELRHLIRDPVDMALAVAANCGASSRFFARHEALMAAQPTFLARVRALPASVVQQWGEGTPTQRTVRIARDSGVTAWMVSRGLTPAQANACLTNQALLTRLENMTNGAFSLGVTGTPSFLLDNVLQGSHSWAELQGSLDAATAAAR